MAVQSWSYHDERPGVIRLLMLISRIGSGWPRPAIKWLAITALLATMTFSDDDPFGLISCHGPFRVAWFLLVLGEALWSAPVGAGKEARLTDRTTRRRPRPPSSEKPIPAAQPAKGQVRRARDALSVLFPEAPDPPAGPVPRPAPQSAFKPVPAPAAESGGQRALYLALQAAAVCAGVLVLLPRIAGIPSWDSVYAEDQGVFLVDALARPWHLFVPYGGYEQLMPRFIGQLVSSLPLMDAAVAYALAGAGIAALCALFIYHAMAGWIRSAWLRALVGVALILLPLAPIEIADCAVGSPWYVLAALFFALLWRPKSWVGMTAAALIAFAAASSEILVLFYAPLVLLRLIALPRWREQAVTAGWVAGLLVQVPVVLLSYAQHTQRVGALAKPIRSLAFYFHNVALRAFGWRVSLHLIHIAGFNGATVIVCAVLAVVFGWGLVTGGRQVRVFIAAALIMGFVESVFATTLVPYVIGQHYDFNFEGGSRYSTMPIMAMTAAVLVAVDAYLHREASAGSREPIPLARTSPRAAAAVVAVVCVLALGWIPDYRYVTERLTWGHWKPQAERLLTKCEHSTNDQVTTWAWGSKTVTFACSRLRR
jgi:hypothetical protein